MSNMKRVRKWYHDNGVEYLDADWGERSEVGETAGPQTQQAERYGRGRHAVERWTDFFDHLQPPWQERTLAEREEVEALEEFFAPYLVRLPKRQEDLIRDVVGNRRTFEAIAELRGGTRQAAHQAFKRAVEALERVFERDGTTMEAALQEYWRRRFNKNYPGLVP